MRRHEQGQASLEAIATVPLILIALLVVAQLAGFVRGVIEAREDARAAALRAQGHGTIEVVGERRVGSVIPGLESFHIRVRQTALLP